MRRIHISLFNCTLYGVLLCPHEHSVQFAESQRNSSFLDYFKEFSLKWTEVQKSTNLCISLLHSSDTLILWGTVLCNQFSLFNTSLVLKLVYNFPLIDELPTEICTRKKRQYFCEKHGNSRTMQAILVCVNYYSECIELPVRILWVCMKCLQLSLIIHHVTKLYC